MLHLHSQASIYLCGFVLIICHSFAFLLDCKLQSCSPMTREKWEKGNSEKSFQLLWNKINKKREEKKGERSGPEHDLFGYACKFIHQWPMHTNNSSRKPKTLIVINMSIFTIIASMYASSNHSFMYCQAIKFLP
jgi:hypothetical protein